MEDFSCNNSRVEVQTWRQGDNVPCDFEADTNSIIRKFCEWLIVTSWNQTVGLFEVLSTDWSKKSSSRYLVYQPWDAHVMVQTRDRGNFIFASRLMLRGDSLWKRSKLSQLRLRPPSVVQLHWGCRSRCAWYSSRLLSITRRFLTHVFEVTLFISASWRRTSGPQSLLCR